LIDAIRSSPSDPRATFFNGNVITCLGAGFAGSIQIGSPTNGNASDPNVSGTVASNAGSIQPGQGEEVNVSITGVGVVIDAVIVKGGNGYNVYSNPAVLPPTLPPPQHYISPLNGGGAVPEISHWFVCYHLTAPPEPGSLTLRKSVVSLRSPRVVPTSYTATVTCGAQEFVVTFGEGGGVGTPAITGLTAGTVCTVAEDVASLPPGVTVEFLPPEANTTGVTIGTGAGIEVLIINNLTNVQPETGTLVIEKVVLPAGPGVALPNDF
jgi:hypothetical protein